MSNHKAGLLIETAEFLKFNQENGANNTNMKKYSACNVTTVNIETDEQSKKYQREKGKYITVECDKIFSISDDDFESVTDVISSYIRGFTDKFSGERIVIAGIGNREITADSIGPKTVDRIIVTRGLEDTEYIGRDCFGNVCAICADVFGVTGIESAELIEGIARVLKPKLIVVVDALATSTVSRLCKTIQISNTSLVPGGGVDNARKSISPDEIDIPLVSIGIPTVVYTTSLVKEKELLGDYSESLITIPSRIDDATDCGAKLIAFALNKALHNDIQTEDILKFLY